MYTNLWFKFFHSKYFFILRMDQSAFALNGNKPT